MRRNLLFLVFCLGWMTAGAWACEDPSCACEKPAQDPPAPQQLTWLEQSTIGGQPGAGLAAQSPARTWKVFPTKFPDVVKNVREHRLDSGQLWAYLAMLGISLLMFAAIVLMVRGRGSPSPGLRRLFQILFVVLWGVVFAQCLCCVKDLAVLLFYGFHGQALYGLCMAWLGLASVAFTFVLRKRFRTAYCYWACPLGAVQDLLGTDVHRRMTSRARIAVLVFLAAVMVAVVIWRTPRPLNLLGAPAMVLLMLGLSILAILRPAWEGKLRRFVFVTLVGWFVLCMAVMFYDMHNLTPGPWCVAGVGNLAYPLVWTFAIVLAASIVVPRAWCRFVCPNRGLYEIVCGRSDRSAEAGEPGEERPPD